FAAFAGVGFSAQVVHRHGQGFVGFGGDRAQRHRAGAEALNDFLCGLNFVQGYGLALYVFGGLELEETAQRAEGTRLFVDLLGVTRVGLAAGVRAGVGCRRLLEIRDALRREQMALAVFAPGILAAVGEDRQRFGFVAFREAHFVAADRFLCKHREADAV